jgi:hypothetical protein
VPCRFVKSDVSVEHIASVFMIDGNERDVQRSNLSHPTPCLVAVTNNGISYRYSVLHSHRCENLKSYIALTG